MAVPILQSLLLADHVYRDQTTGKYIICGVFSTIFFTPNPPPESSGENSGQQNSGGNGSRSGNGGSGTGNAGLAGSGGQTDDPRRENKPGGTGEPTSKSQSIQSLMQAGSPYAYFSVTELKEKKTFEVRYVDLYDNRVLFQAEVPIECEDPLKTIEVSMPLPRLPLVALEERSYALEILCEGQLLGSHRVLARMTPGSSPPTT